MVKARYNPGAIGLVEILLITVLIAVVGFVDWRINETNEVANQPIQSSDTGLEQPKQEEPKKRTVLIELKESVEIVKASDLDKLPEETPEEFLQYMKSKIATDKPFGDCTRVYTIGKLSSLNVQGSTSFITAANSDQICVGHVMTIWYVDDNNDWQTFGTQEVVPCEKLKTMKIYAEFLEECYVKATDKLEPNPNGPLPKIR